MILQVFAQAVADEHCTICPASSYTALGAAYETLGLYLQADILYQMRATFFGHWATLLYVLGAAGGLIGLAMGQPPRTYLWFFLGPSIYNFLIFTLVPITGVRWMVAEEGLDQTQVWKLAEAGLRNQNVVRGYGITVSSKEEPRMSSGGVDGVSSVQVANAFVFIDALLSSNIQWMITWTGAYNADGEGTPDQNVVGAKSAGAGTTATNGQVSDAASWHILANVKWGLLHNITGATLRSSEARDVFTQFLSNECGDGMKRILDTPTAIAAQRTSGRFIPSTMFRSFDELFYSDEEGIDTLSRSDVQQSVEVRARELLAQELLTIYVPTPRGLRKLYDDKENRGSFAKFDKYYAGQETLNRNEYERISCVNYLDDLIQIFRWEAGHALHHLELASPKGVSVRSLRRALFYGWNIRESEGAQHLATDDNKLRAFTTDMMLAHLFRNELEVTTPVVDQKFDPTTQSVGLAETQLRTSGAINKYGELYTWAVMMPYVQGILLYVLTAAYPFAAMLIVMPGWHKTFMTWLSFFCWAKLWDVGFAFTHSVERTVWAQLGNNSNVATVSKYVIAMQSLGKVGVSCPDGNTGALHTCAVPLVCNTTSADLTCGTNPGEHLGLGQTLEIFDQALTVGASLDLDLANSYYLYIMSALYLAVPAVTGQIVLGSRAGAAQLLSGMVSGVASNAGSAAQQGFQGDQVNRMHSNLQGSAPQARQSARMRETGLGAAALEAGNAGIQHGLAQSSAQARAQGTRGLEQNARNSLEAFNSAAAPAAHVHDQTTNGRHPILLMAGGLNGGGSSGGIIPGIGLGANFSATAASTAQFATSGVRSAMNGGQTSPQEVAAAENARQQVSNALSAQGRGDLIPRLGLPQPQAPQNGQQQNAPQPPVNARPGTGVTGTGGGPEESRSAYFATALPPSHVAYGAFGGGGVKWGQWLASQDSIGAGWLANRVGADSGVTGFAAGGLRDGAGLSGSRLNQAANFDAETEAWHFKAQNAAAMSGKASVWGAMAGSLSPGQKPAGIEGMAMSGMLGGHAESLASYPMGDFRREVGARRGELDAMYGGHAMGMGPANFNPGDLYANSATWGHSLYGNALRSSGSDAVAMFSSMSNYDLARTSDGWGSGSARTREYVTPGGAQATPRVPGVQPRPPGGFTDR